MYLRGAGPLCEAGHRFHPERDRNDHSRPPACRATGGQVIFRLTSIPHGNALLAQGTATGSEVVRVAERGYDADMATVFTRIMNGELPGRFIYSDDLVVAFLSIAPVSPGHTLVVTREEIDQWTDAPETLLQHCLSVARRIGNAAKEAFGAPRAGLVIAGLEVPHLHVHVFPAWSMETFDFAQAKPASDTDLDNAAEKLRAALGGA